MPAQVEASKSENFPSRKSVSEAERKPGLDGAEIRKQFPILKREIHGQSLAYLDNAATTQKPATVIDAVTEFYRHSNSNVSRGVYTLAEEATAVYEGTRKKAAGFIHAPHAENIVFTSGTTASINLVANAWARPRLRKGDSIIVTEMEHHSNLVPWQLVAGECGAGLVFWPVTSEGRLALEKLEPLLNPSVSLLAVTAVSNVLGTVNEIRDIITLAHRHRIPVLIDAAQAAARLEMHVLQWDCDFLAFSGHKVYGPTGIGVLYAKSERMREMRPWQGGGGMIGKVERERSSWAEPPALLEAGTPPFAQAAGLSAAIEFLEKTGMENVRAHEIALTEYALNCLRREQDVEVYGPETVDSRAGVIAFNLAGVHPHDVAQILDESGIAVRAGHHCTQVLHEKLGAQASVRISFGVYNTKDEIDRLIDSLQHVREILQ